MTKFVLIGGLPHSAPDGGRSLFAEITVGLIEPIKILDVLFARDPATWPNKLALDQHFYQQNLPGIRLETKPAHIDSFTAQVKWADIIMLKGGDTAPLLAALKHDLSWTKYLDGKVVVGSSAGAYVLARYYHELEHPKLGTGLGLVPVKIASHWQSQYYKADWEQVRRDLETHGEPLPLVLQREGEYAVFNSPSGPEDKTATI